MILEVGATSVSVDVQVVDNSGLPVLALVAATFPATTYSLAGPQAAVLINLIDLALITSPWASGGLKELSGGYYRLDIPDAVFSSGGIVRLAGEVSGKHLLAESIQVGNAPVDPVSVRAAVGMSSPNLDVQLGTIDADVNAAGVVTDGINTVVLAINTRLPANPAATGDAMTLTSGERSAVATAWGARVVGNKRTADYFLQGAMNKVSFDVPTVGKVTIYQTDDSTPLNVADYTPSASGTPPVASLDPA